MLMEKPTLVWERVETNPQKERENLIKQFQIAAVETKAIVLDMFHPPLEEKDRFPVVQKALINAEYHHGKNQILSAQEIAKVLLIADANAHEYIGEATEYTLYTFGSSGSYIRKGALFHLASKAAHSCDPNCFTTSKWGDGLMRMICVKPIPKGSMVTQSYMECGSVPTPARRSELSLSKCFVCMCSRCIAPDNCRGLRCGSKQCSGVAFRCDGSHVAWRCSKCGKELSDDDMREAFSAEDLAAQSYGAMERAANFGMVTPDDIERAI